MRLRIEYYYHHQIELIIFIIHNIKTNIRTCKPQKDTDTTSTLSTTVSKESTGPQKVIKKPSAIHLNTVFITSSEHRLFSEDTCSNLEQESQPIIQAQQNEMKLLISIKFKIFYSSTIYN